MTNVRINKLIKAVKQDQYYIPRDYKTIGGAWTTDTWRRGPVTVMVMDEGYTTVVHAPGLEVVTGYNGEEYVDYRLGDVFGVERMLARFGVE